MAGRKGAKKLALERRWMREGTAKPAGRGTSLADETRPLSL